MSEKSYNEVIEIQEVVEKRQKSYKEFQEKLTKELSQQKEKCAQLEKELKEEVLKVQQLQKQIVQYESLIREYSLRLNTEEESFKMERIQKERYAKENQNLENEIRKYKALLENVPSNNIYCMPTTINVNTSHANGNTTTSVSQLNDVSNLSNTSNVSFNISRKLPSGTGSRFIMADEEGEFMDPNHLQALKRGQCSLNDSPFMSDDQRMSTLQRRNTMVLPHLRTSYAVELPYLSNSVSEDFIRSGLPNNDSLQTLKQIENLSFQRNEFVCDKRNNSLSCDNLNISTNRPTNNR
jgi:hypothetical protein